MTYTCQRSESESERKSEREGKERRKERRRHSSEAAKRKEKLYIPPHTKYTNKK
jgi:hypothetical protein